MATVTGWCCSAEAEAPEDMTQLLPGCSRTRSRTASYRPSWLLQAQLNLAQAELTRQDEACAHPVPG